MSFRSIDFHKHTHVNHTQIKKPNNTITPQGNSYIPLATPPPKGNLFLYFR